MEAGDLCPGQISFGGFDDAAWCSVVRPSVTLIEQPTYEIGTTATELLLKRIEEPTRSIRQVVLKHRMLIRHSCGCCEERNLVAGSVTQTEHSVETSG
jgi:DNA-binding LacI/PurR family transcriptional regulator